MKRHRRTQAAMRQMQAVLTPATAKRTAAAERVSTFPARFVPLRDRLFERAKTSPEFLSSVFTRVEGETPTDDEIMQSIENRLFDLLASSPWWFGQTQVADAQGR